MKFGVGCGISRAEVVKNAGYDYIAIYSDGSNGTIFKTPSGSMAISDEIYWNIGGFEKIYK